MTDTEKQHSAEEKFFGKKTTIDEMMEAADEIESGEDEEDIEIQVADEDSDDDHESRTGDDELDSYSEKVQKRIDRLTWEREEAKRQAKKAEEIRAEAVRYAQAVNQKNQEQAELIANGEAHLVEQIKNRAALAVEKAENKYRQAYETGNTDAIIQAQKELNLAQAEQLESYNYEQDYNYRRQAWINQQQQRAQYQQQSQQYQQKPKPQGPTEGAKAWAEKNPWFGKPAYRDMTALAYAEHERLTRDEGIRADTEEYYARIDAKVQKHFPDYFADRNPRKPNTVVAPGKRNNGSKPHRVRLEPHQIALAKQLGITPEQYARQALKESKNG